MLIIKKNTEEIRNFLEEKGFSYAAKCPPKEYGSCIAVDTESKNYTSWKDIDEVLKILKILKEEFGIYHQYQILGFEDLKIEVG